MLLPLVLLLRSSRERLAGMKVSVATVRLAFLCGISNGGGLLVWYLGCGVVDACMVIWGEPGLDSSSPDVSVNGLVTQAPSSDSCSSSTAGSCGADFFGLAIKECVNGDFRGLPRPPGLLSFAFLLNLSNRLLILPILELLLKQSRAFFV